MRAWYCKVKGLAGQEVQDLLDLAVSRGAKPWESVVSTYKSAPYVRWVLLNEGGYFGVTTAEHGYKTVVALNAAEFGHNVIELNKRNVKPFICGALDTKINSQKVWFGVDLGRDDRTVSMPARRSGKTAALKSTLTPEEFNKLYTQTLAASDYVGAGKTVR